VTTLYDFTATIDGQERHYEVTFPMFAKVDVNDVLRS